ATGTGTGFADLEARVFPDKNRESHGALWMASSRLEDEASFKELSAPDARQFVDSVDSTMIGFDGVTIIVGAQTGVRELSFARLKAIFTRKERKWEDGSPIVLCVRNPGSGTSRDLEAKVEMANRSLDDLPRDQFVIECASHVEVVTRVMEG